MFYMHFSSPVLLAAQSYQNIQPTGGYPDFTSVLPHFASDVINRFLQSFDFFLAVVHRAMNSQTRKEKGFCGNLRAKFPLIKKNTQHIFLRLHLMDMFIPHCLNITLLNQGKACYAFLLLSHLDIKPVIVDCSAVGSLENEISFE